jgi:DNA-binding transcriptional LysR family regulator
MTAPGHGAETEFSARPEGHSAGPVLPPLSQLAALTLLKQHGNIDRLIRMTRRSRRSVLQQLDRFESSIKSISGDPTASILTNEGSLNAQGEALLEHARAIHDAAAAWTQAVQTTFGSSGVVKIAGFPAHIELLVRARELLADRRTSRNSADSPTTLEIVVLDGARGDQGVSLLHDLEMGLLDLAIVPRPPIDRATTVARSSTPTGPLFRTPLYDWQLIAAMTDKRGWVRSASMPSVSRADLVGRALLASPPGHISRALLDAADVTVDFASDSTDALIAMAASGFGVAILPADAVPVRLVSGLGRTTRSRVTSAEHWPVFKPDDRALGGGYDAVCRRDRQTDQRIIDALAQLDNALPAFLGTSSGLSRPDQSTSIPDEK